MEEIATKTNKKQKVAEEQMINPLRAEKITVKFVPHAGGPHGDNPDHPLAGGKADGTNDKFCVPLVGKNYKNVLTNAEKDFLEEALNLDKNAMSVYKTVNNYWDDFYVTVPKEGLSLDLMSPIDYIQYKVLLANTETIASSLEQLQDTPKNTYRYVMIKENDEAKLESEKMDNTMACYKEFGKIDSDYDTMRVLVELLDAKPLAANTPVEYLRSRINQLIQADSRVFLKAITDPLLHTKVLLRRSVEIGKITKRGDYYLTLDNMPLCDNGQNPTLSVAARWLNLPAHQDLKAILEVAVSDARTK